MYRDIFYSSLSRFTRHTNSAKLGRPAFDTNYAHNCHTKSFQFGQAKCNNVYRAKEIEYLVHQQHRGSMMTSTSTPKQSREYQQQQQESINILMIKQNENIHTSLPDSPFLLRRHISNTRKTSHNQFLWRMKPQITL